LAGSAKYSSASCPPRFFSAADQVAIFPIDFLAAEEFLKPPSRSLAKNPSVVPG